MKDLFQTAQFNISHRPLKAFAPYGSNDKAECKSSLQDFALGLIFLSTFGLKFIFPIQSKGFLINFVNLSSVIKPAQECIR